MPAFSTGADSIAAVLAGPKLTPTPTPSAARFRPNISGVESALIVTASTTTLVSITALYSAYAWCAVEAVRGIITLGEMTMYIMLFRQGQAAVTASLGAIGGMYEDNLYLSTLYEYLEQPVEESKGTAVSGPDPEAGVQFEDVEFRYPGSDHIAITGVNLQIKRGESLALVGENGSGKTTLIKLLTRLYKPTHGRVLLDGRDLQEWDPIVLRRRIGVIFQDFVRYQLMVGENVGAGDVRAFEDEQRWREAAVSGKAAPFIEEMPLQYQTQLGKWFKDGRELSGGQWQKIALSRAFMRSDADILVLDEPTAAMDAAERHRQHIRENFYGCGYPMHECLARIYVGDPRFTANYDSVEPGLAQYVHDAILANSARHTSGG